MPIRGHVNLPGPVAYSRPIRRKGKKPGPLTRILVWFVVKPLEAIWCQLVSMATPPKAPVKSPRATHGYFRPSELGWHDTQFGPLYWSGTNWYDRDGRPLF